MPEIKREIAIKTNIATIINGIYHKEEGWQPNYIEINNERISRANIIATIIEKIPEERTLIIDDGTGKIKAKSFEDVSFLDKADIGDVVLIIARVREFNNEKFLNPEIVKKIESTWLKVRLKELSKKIVVKQEIKVFEEDIKENLPLVERMLKKIREFDKGQGTSIELLINNQDDETVIERMIQDGIIFEVRPGKIEILE